MARVSSHGGLVVRGGLLAAKGFRFLLPDLAADAVRVDGPARAKNLTLVPVGDDLRTDPALLASGGASPKLLVRQKEKRASVDLVSNEMPQVI